VGTWQLFVDESGGFARPGDGGVVAGVLVRGYPAPQSDHALATALRIEARCGSPYPPHERTDHRLCAPLVFADLPITAFESSSHGAVTRRRDALRGHATAFRASNDPAGTEARRRARAYEGAWHPPDQFLDTLFVKADDGVARDAALAPAMQSDRHARTSQMRALCREASQRIGAAGAWLVGVVNLASDREPPAPLHARDPYLHCLDLLLARAALLAHRHDGAAHLFPMIASRDIWTPTRRAPGTMTREDLYAAVTRAKDRVPPRVAASVGIHPFPPVSYDRHVPAGVVLADFAAFHVADVLRGATADWPTIAARAREATGLAVELPTPDGLLPTLTASGPWDDAIVAAARAVPCAPSPSRPPWLHAQSEVWTQIARGLR
jgi:hypothetical protein